MKEIWKTIPGFSRYQASSTGLLRSTNYKNSGKTKILSPSNSDGYLKTMLQSDSGKYKTWNVHKFISITFYGDSKGKEVNHIDGNKLNNSVVNLEYCTRSENIKHAVRKGLQPIMHGSKNGNSKLTESQVRAIRKAKQVNGRFWGRNKIAKELGMNPKHLQRIVNDSDNLWKRV